MKLSELIDLENQLLKDQELEPGLLRKRDRRIGLSLQKMAVDRKKLFLAWLENINCNSQNSIGQHIERGHMWVRILLLVTGFLSGLSLGSALLSYDGTNPVNIVHFLAVFIGLQSFFLLAVAINIAPRLLTSFLPGTGEFQKLLRALTYFLGRRIEKALDHIPEEKRSALQQDWGRISRRHRIYTHVERWLLLSTTQRFGVAFNLGALGACLYLIIFTDIAFAWNTTLEIKAASFHHIIGFVARPWAWFFPEGVPSLQLVEATRYFRIDGDYVNPLLPGRFVNPEIVGGWWPFLILSLVFYGLLPRLFFSGFANLKYRLALKKTALETADYDALYDRLMSPIVETRALSSETGGLQKEKADSIIETEPIRKGECSLLQWGEIEFDLHRTRRVLESRFGLVPKEVYAAGGMDALQDKKVIVEIGAEPDQAVPLVIIVESWEVPSKAIIWFLAELRKEIQEKRAILIALLNIDEDMKPVPPATMDWQNWRRSMAESGDPFLRVEAIVEFSL